MSARICFIKNNAEKTVTHLFTEHYVDFRNWYLCEEKYILEHYHETFGLKNVLNFFSGNPELPQNFTKLDNQLFNDLIVEFVINSWDKQKEFFEFFGPMINRSRYEKSYLMVTAMQDQDFITLWQYITVGRNFATLAPYRNPLHEINIGFLDRDEYLTLQHKIEQHFGNIENLRKLDYVGLECVLQALLELAPKNNQFISIIET